MPAAVDLDNLNGTGGFVVNGVTGYSVTGSDFNGDGKSDLVVGAISIRFAIFLL